MLMAAGYRFYKEKDFGNKTRWQCSFKKTKCKAAIITMGEEIVKTNFKHNHLPRSYGKPEFVKVLGNCKLRSYNFESIKFVNA